MATKARIPMPRQRGFSLTEMLIVVAIVAIMAAVALPNIGHYIRNYRIKGAAQLVAGELNAARSKAIMSNTNLGVSFVTVDRDTFRFVQEDIRKTDDPQGLRLSGLKRLPTGVIFVPTTLANGGPTLRFQRLGGFCNPADTASTCRTAVPVADRYDATTEGAVLDATTMDQPYIGAEAAGTVEIRVRETTTGLERTVRIAPGGRVAPQQ
jgi:prepilin-type N-terminal cleavage/methylation domain-containing protein